ncbi:MAG: ATP-binding protein [Desulfovibrionales bacterium]|nr:ATP-binding protein [Desulfovibrionales bacterium]
MSFECHLNKLNFECTFSADISLVDRTVAKVEQFLNDRCSSKIFFNITILLREALNNAIFHGAGQDKSLLVSCSAYIENNRVIFVVISPGVGFPWEKCIDKDPTGSTSQSGWGMFLIKQYSDGFEYDDSGRELKFWVNLSENDI